MTEEEASQLREVHAAQLTEKDQRIEERESMLMAALLRMEE